MREADADDERRDRARLEAAGPAPAQPKSKRRRVLQGLFSLVLVIAIFVFVLPQVADFSKVWDNIRAMTWLELDHARPHRPLEPGHATGSCGWRVCPGSRWRQAAVATEASTAVANTVPGGSYLAVGITYAMFHSWGFRRSVITLALLVSGIFNNFAKLAVPVLALVFLALQGNVTAGRVIAGLLGIAALVGGGGRVRPGAAHRAVGGAASATRRRAWPRSSLASCVAHRPPAGTSRVDPLPGEDDRPAAGPLARHHVGHADEPSVALPRAARHAAPHRGLGGRGQLGRGARGVRLRPAGHRHPVDAGRSRRGRAGADDDARPQPAATRRRSWPRCWSTGR